MPDINQQQRDLTSNALLRARRRLRITNRIRQKSFRTLKKAKKIGFPVRSKARAGSIRKANKNFDEAVAQRDKITRLKEIRRRLTNKPAKRRSKQDI